MLKKVLLPLLLPLILMFVSCNGGQGNRLQRDDLFSISPGKMADEIDYFQRQSLRFSKDNGMVMKNGFFYITNGRSGKFLKFNSYGDLLTLIYNPDRNPYPAEMTSRDSENVAVNRQVIPWQFNSPGALAVTDKQIYIVDKVASNRQIRDKDVLMDRSILQFNADGEYENFIGMEGKGGQPFPYIENIWVSSKSELIVLYRTRTADGDSWFVNWYTPSGNLRYNVEIRESAIPMPAGENDLKISIDNVIPDRDKYEIYLKMTYFRRGKDNEDEVFGGTLDFSVEDSQWHDWTRLPDYKVNLDGTEIDSPYSLIGIAHGYKFFASLGSDNCYDLLIRDNKGHFLKDHTLFLGEGNIIENSFQLSESGILSAMVFREDKADIVWWRTDKLISDGDNG